MFYTWMTVGALAWGLTYDLILYEPYVEKLNLLGSLGCDYAAFACYLFIVRMARKRVGGKGDASSPPSTDAPTEL